MTNKLPKPAKRYKARADKAGDYGFNDDKTNLDDLAYEGKMSNAQTGDFISVDVDTEDGDKDWFEIIDSDGAYKYVYPVDETGKALTKTKLEKMGKSSWLKSIEKHGYAKYFEVRNWPDPILIVDTEDIEDWSDSKPKDLGRRIDRRPVYDEEDVYDDDDMYVGKNKYQINGNADFRKSVNDRRAANAKAADDRAGRLAKYNDLAHTAGDPWSNIDSLVKELKKLHPDASDEDLKEFGQEAKNRGYGYPEMSDQDYNDLKTVIGVTRAEEHALSGAAGDTFSQARRNAYYANN